MVHKDIVCPEKRHSTETACLVSVQVHDVLLWPYKCVSKMSRVLIYISKNEIRNLALYSLYNTMQKEMDEDHNYLI